MFERDVVEPLSLGEQRGPLDHLLRDVDAERPPVAGEAGRITRGLPHSAADVQHLVIGTNLIGAPQRVVVQAKFGVIVDMFQIAVAHALHLATELRMHHAQGARSRGKPS